MIDFAASREASVNEAALNNMREYVDNLRILGEFSSAESSQAIQQLRLATEW